VNAHNPYVGAYPELPGRRAVWGAIARFVARDARNVGLLVELGAGYCDFSAQFPAKRKLAFDLNPEMRRFAPSDVELRIESALSLPGVAPGSADLVFASNFLEHLGGEELDEMLASVRRALAPGGRLILIQPNHRLCAERYFDDPTHRTIFDDANVGEWLARHGLRVVKLVPGLLPLTMNSRLPKWGWLTRLYLALPFRPLAAQMYVVAEPV
jgi:SAM-dependent methyltransferase